MDLFYLNIKVYYIGFISGYFSKKDLIEWADDLMDRLESFLPYEIIEIALSYDKSDLDIYLMFDQLLRGKSFNNEQWFIYGFCYNDFKSKKFSISDIISITIKIDNHNNQYAKFRLPEHEYEEISNIRVDYFVGRDVNQAILDFLQKFENFNKTMYYNIINNNYKIPKI